MSTLRGTGQLIEKLSCSSAVKRVLARAIALRREDRFPMRVRSVMSCGRRSGRRLIGAGRIFAAPTSPGRSCALGDCRTPI